MGERENDAATDPAGAETLELYRLYLATAEAVSDRRAAANKWMIAVNAALAAAAPVLGDTLAPLALSAAGVVVCLAWAALLASFRKLNTAKFRVLHEIEARMAFAPFARESEIYRELGRRPLSSVERAVPFAFIGLHLAGAAAAITWA